MNKQISLFGVQYEEPKKECNKTSCNKKEPLTDQEYLESIGQTNIFDYLEITPTSKRNKSFVQGDKVKLRMYVDEVDFIKECHPQLLEVGTVFELHQNYYSVKFGNDIVKIDGEKLLLL